MMSEVRFTARCVTYLKEGYFSGELRWFFRKIIDLYGDMRVPPSSHTIEAEISKHTDIEEMSKYSKELAEILKTSPQPDYIKRELTGFIRANLFVGAYREAAQLYNSGNKDDAYQITSRHLEDLIRVDFEKERMTIFGDHKELIDIASKQRGNAIPTGILAIDEAMGGGLFPQTWTTFLGGSNSGKSMLMANLAYYAVMAGKKVFVTIHEDEELPTKLRYLSRFSGIPFTKLMAPYSYLTQDDKEQLEAADAVLKEHVILRFMYGTESTVEAVQQAARLLHKDWAFELFLCDYGQCLTTARFKSLDNTRLLQEFVYSELKQLCLELNCAGAGGAQVNRLGHQTAKKGTDYLRSTDVGESWGIVKKSSNVITINRSDEHIKNNRIVFLLDKVRNGRCPVAVSCVTDYSRCLTHADSLSSNGDPRQHELNSMDIGEAVAHGYVSTTDEPAQAQG